jgi:signal transduction histidine kinase
MSIVLCEVDRLNQMIADLLAYARPRAPELQDVDLLGLLDETLRVFQQDRSQSDVTARLSPEPGCVARVDPNQIRQVVWNLLRNAAEAMPKGGEIVVRLLQGKDGVGFEIGDSGEGIAAEDLERVFDPFFTTKDAGTGLGLATVHRIVEDHRGRVEVESGAGKGTRVRVWLPVAGQARVSSARS